MPNQGVSCRPRLSEEPESESKLLSAFSPIGEVGWGSIPLAIVGSIAFLLILLRYASIRMVPLANDNRGGFTC